jgi:hypothetical protein
MRVVGFQIIQGLFVSWAMAKCEEDPANCLQNPLKHRRNSPFAGLNLKRCINTFDSFENGRIYIRRRLKRLDELNVLC